MDRKHVKVAFGGTTGLLVVAVAIGCGPLPQGHGPVRSPEVVPKGFQCANALVDFSTLPVSQVRLLGEPELDAFLYHSAELHAHALAIERAVASMANPHVRESIGVDVYACAGKEVQDAILGLTQTGESLVQRAPAMASSAETYCRAHPLMALSVGKRLAEATNQVRGSLQSLARSGQQVGLIVSQATGRPSAN